MASFTFIGQNLSIKGGNIIVVSGAQFSLVLTDDDNVIGDPGDTGENVSIDSAPATPYTFLGIGTTDVNESMAVLELPDGSFVGFNTDGTTLRNGNTKVGPADLVSTPFTPCFTPGTKVLTPKGYVLVETLGKNDLVMTRDNGAQPVRHIIHRRLSGADLTTRRQPIRIQKGAFGDGLPLAEILVSPQHRFLISGWRSQLLIGEDSGLTTASSLCNDDSIRQLNDQTDVTYIHIILDDHQIIIANGVETESVLLSDDFLDGLPIMVRLELEDMFGHPNAQASPNDMPAAAPMLRHFEGALVLSS